MIEPSLLNIANDKAEVGDVVSNLTKNNKEITGKQDDNCHFIAKVQKVSSILMKPPVEDGFQIVKSK